MTYKFENFCAECRDSLIADNGPAGREAIVGHLEKLLADEEFVQEKLGPDQPPGRRTIYEDPDAGFCVLFHNYDRKGGGTPHDHGDSWAVYGQAREFTDIKEFNRLDDGSDDDQAELEVSREFRMNSGKAALFDTGVIHSINFIPGGRVVRVTGTDLDKIPKWRFDLKNKKALLWLEGASGQ
jgi:hypothetical protein